EEETLCIRVGLLVRAGRQPEAVKVLGDSLASATKFSEATLLRLAAISRGAKLGVEDKCFARCEKEHGITAALAYAEAAQQFSGARGAEGLPLFNALRARAPEGERDSIDWQIAV